MKKIKALLNKGIEFAKKDKKRAIIIGVVAWLGIGLISSLGDYNVDTEERYNELHTEVEEQMQEEEAKRKEYEEKKKVEKEAKKTAAEKGEKYIEDRYKNSVAVVIKEDTDKFILMSVKTKSDKSDEQRINIALELNNYIKDCGFTGDIKVVIGGINDKKEIIIMNGELEDIYIK